MNINDTRPWLMASIRLGAMLLLGCLPQGAAAEKPAAPKGGTIKVGVLHSLSGTMAIGETTLKDTVLMMIDEQNKAGGLLGKELEAVVVDPASNWPLFAEKAHELIQKEKVAVVFGCWTKLRRCRRGGGMRIASRSTVTVVTQEQSLFPGLRRAPCGVNWSVG